MPDSFLSRVERLAELEKKATPGDWEHLYEDGEASKWVVLKDKDGAGVDIAEAFDGPHDAAFIAAARNLMPHLLRKLEQQRKALEAIISHEDKAAAELENIYPDGKSPELPWMSQARAALAESVEEPK